MEQGIDQRSASSGEVFLSVAVSQLTLVCCGTRCPGTTRFQDGTLQGHSPRGVRPQDRWVLGASPASLGGLRSIRAWGLLDRHSLNSS